MKYKKVTQSVMTSAVKSISVVFTLAGKLTEMEMI
jgi:hypothetical protein